MSSEAVGSHPITVRFAPISRSAPPRPRLAFVRPADLEELRLFAKELKGRVCTPAASQINLSSDRSPVASSEKEVPPNPTPEHRQLKELEEFLPIYLDYVQLAKTQDVSEAVLAQLSKLNESNPSTYRLLRNGISAVLKKNDPELEAADLEANIHLVLEENPMIEIEDPENPLLNESVMLLAIAHAEESVRKALEGFKRSHVPFSEVSRFAKVLEFPETESDDAS